MKKTKSVRIVEYLYAERCNNDRIWVANKAMELMGAHGYAFDYNVEKYLRDAKILQLWLGGPQRALLDSALGYYDFEW